MSRFLECSLRDMSPSEVGWLAGLMEGEGSFMCIPEKGRTVPRLQAQMTDLDVLERAMDLTGCGYLHTVRRREEREAHKQTYQWSVRAVRDVQAVTELLLPHLCERRTGQAVAVLDLCAERLARAHPQAQAV